MAKVYNFHDFAAQVMNKWISDNMTGFLFALGCSPVVSPYFILGVKLQMEFFSRFVLLRYSIKESNLVFPLIRYCNPVLEEKYLKGGHCNWVQGLRK